jgi:hypothetical protein
MTTAAEGNPYLDITDHGTVHLLGAYYKASSKPARQYARSWEKVCG